MRGSLAGNFSAKQGARISTTDVDTKTAVLMRCGLVEFYKLFY